MSQAHHPSLLGKRILIVEDEYFIADELKKVFADGGAVVVGPVPTLDRAVDMVGSERIDLAVLDINLRGLSVFPVADALQSRGIPFVFATGYDENAIPGEYRGVPRWEKPFNSSEIAAALPSLWDNP